MEVTQTYVSERRYFLHVINPELFTVWEYMVAKETKACGKEVQKYIQLQMFSLEDDRLCPINFEQVKRTLRKKELGYFQMHHIGASLRERRGNKMLDTNDVFGRSRHDSEQIQCAF